jgi:hypothetical protein
MTSRCLQALIIHHHQTFPFLLFSVALLHIRIIFNQRLDPIRVILKKSRVELLITFDPSNQKKLTHKLPNAKRGNQLNKFEQKGQSRIVINIFLTPTFPHLKRLEDLLYKKHFQRIPITIPHRINFFPCLGPSFLIDKVQVSPQEITAAPLAGNIQ